MANKYPKEVEGNVLMWLGGEMAQAIYTGFRSDPVKANAAFEYEQRWWQGR